MSFIPYSLSRLWGEGPRLRAIGSRGTERPSAMRSGRGVARVRACEFRLTSLA
ncbi:hypothetical protein LG3211_1334 [Lysobacter gummosus]|nr:hypothetical protein LG3211_1334 [Lysobacter gummosus]